MANKSEGEKMIVTLVDAKSLDEAHGIWTNLHNKFPDDAMSYYYYYYIITMSDTTKVFDSLTEYLQKYPWSPEAMNNK